MNNKKIISSGFIVRSKDRKYLLGKACNREKNSWTVFKGGQEEDESLIQTAIRELKEETSIDIESNCKLQKCISTTPIHTYSLKDKTVYIFLLDDKYGELDGVNFSCMSFWGEEKPEIIDFRWFSIDEMEDALFKSQKQIVDVLKGI